MTRKTMRNRGFEPWTFRSCLGYHHFVINDNNRDQRKKDSKKTSTATVAEIKTKANVAEKASALVAATDHGDHMPFDSRQVSPLRPSSQKLFPRPMDIQTRQTIGCGIKRGKLYYLDLQSNDSNKLQQALMADGSEEKKKKMTWLCLMKTKDEVNLLFQNFHKMIETQYNAKTTYSNTPQQNGVAERKNRHLLEVVRASLIVAKILISYWGEAITSATYLINRVPSSPINFQTPLQALTNAIVAPTVPNLPPRVFGGICAFTQTPTHQVNFPCIAMCVCWICIAQKGISMLPSSNSTNVCTMDVEAGELDMSGQQFGSEDVFTEIPNQSSSAEGVLNLELDPFMKRLPHCHNRAIPNGVQEALADPRWKAAMNEEMK
ncbi:Retrovirus-related Pol polyprotein from transposon TNT 1-94 [Vitis vinifera]|uniref:Retrovirus-related Pol polyprotein from transposon TNT 1-94 n=1 Tax=Vitis vinifera TaxID=29760 RepID=A0A438CGH7_VITVI|nr:Retrovirus-related Pol polyprotein from transposon TNT 1-94 [Vitis vinifera]